MKKSKTPRLDAVIDVKDISDEKLKRIIQKYIKTKYVDLKLSKAIYCKWKVGVTNNPDRRYKQNLPQGKKILRFWKCWNAETKERALEVERYFCNKGFIKCKNNFNEQDNTIYIYAFMIPKVVKKKTKK